MLLTIVQLPAHSLVSTSATQSASHSRRAITLVRPAGHKVILFEQPFDLERLLEHIRRLYPVHPLTPEGRYDHLSVRLIRVNVSDQSRPSGFEQIASISDAELNKQELQDHYLIEILPRLKAVTNDEHVWVVRTFVRILL